MPDRCFVGVSESKVYGFDSERELGRDPTDLVFGVEREGLEVKVHQRVNVRVLELIDSETGAAIELEGPACPGSTPATSSTSCSPPGRRSRELREQVAAPRASQQETHMELLDLTPDELLSTTRAVRRRLDLTRPVERDVLEECVRLAVQAPTSTNTQNWHFLIVTDAARKAALADLYRRSWTVYNGGQPPEEAPADTGSRYLAQHLEHVPVHVIPCI